MLKFRLGIVLIFLAIFGVMLTVGSISDMIKMNGTMPYFNSADEVKNLKKGDIAVGFVWNVYGNYANQTTTETTMGIETSSYTSREYFVLGIYPDDENSEEEYYLTVSASKKNDIDMLRRVRDFENENESWENHPEYPIYTKVKKLDSDLNGFLLDGIEKWEVYGSRAEIQRYIVPFELSVYDPKTATTNLIVGVVMLGIAIVGGFLFWKIVIRKKEKEVVLNETPPYQPPNRENAEGDSAFAETYSPALPMVSQPVQPDEFFARPEKPKPVPQKETKAENKPEPKPANAASYEDTNLETSGLDTDAKLTEQEQAVAANAKHIEYDNVVSTDELDTDRKLYEQEQAIAANAKQVEYDNVVSTDELDTDRKLYEQEQAVAANAKQVEYDNVVSTDELDTDAKLTEQEQALAAVVKQAEYGNEIDTSELDIDSLEYYSAPEEDDDDIFIFSNDIDFEDADASKIEIT